MTQQCFWRINPFVRRIEREWGMSPSRVIGMLRADGYRWVDIATAMQCSMSTIGRHIREQDKGYLNITEAGREVLRQNAAKINAKMIAGTVKRGGFAKTRW